MFKREPKMKTTEPSADEVKGLKKGGKAHMALGGGLPNRQITGAMPPALAAQMAQGQGRASMMQPRAVARPASGMPVMRKKGGEVESKKMEAREEREIKGIKKELKSHEGMKAGKAHKGLKAGGLLGGIEASKAHTKAKTGDIEGSGYKHGGKMHKAKGGSVAAEANTKVVGAKQRKSITSKTGEVESVGYKHGGHMKKYAAGGSVAKYENTLVHGGPKMPTKKPSTGEIKQKPAGYKEGGHVSMSDCASKHSYGHNKIDHHPMKTGGKVVC